jgi:hypothetical protein
MPSAHVPLGYILPLNHTPAVLKKKKKVSVLVSGKKEGEGAATSICHSVE